MSKTPRTDREEYVTTKNDIGFKVVNPALCRIMEEQGNQVVDFGKKVAVWFTGDPYEDGVKDFATALAAIKVAHELGVERNDEFKELRVKYKELCANYEELIMAVSNKYPGETRHQTALRYIREREQSVGRE